MVTDADVQKAIAVLVEAGKQHYKPEYAEKASEAESIGLALAWRFGDRDIAQLAYSALEDMNAHKACLWINWFFGLYDAGYYRLDDLNFIASNVSCTVNAITDWDHEKSDYNRQKFTMKATVKAGKVEVLG